MFHATMRAAIDGTRTLAHVDELSRSIWQAHGSGAVTDDEAQVLAEALQGRRNAIRGVLAPVGVPAGRVSLFPPRCRQRSPDRAESRSRRRLLAASGPMPPQLAARFTEGQRAALRIVADEIAAKGVCGLAIDTIAARAGICGRLAQQALRLAASDGLLVIEERRHQGRKNDPNLVRIISREWLAWIRRGRRGDRVNLPSPHGYKGSIPARSRPAGPKEGIRSDAGDPDGRGRSRIRAGGGEGRAMR